MCEGIRRGEPSDCFEVPVRGSERGGMLRHDVERGVRGVKGERVGLRFHKFSATNF